jgi:hypothetical protein
MEKENSAPPRDYVFVRREWVWEEENFKNNGFFLPRRFLLLRRRGSILLTISLPATALHFELILCPIHTTFMPTMLSKAFVVFLLVASNLDVSRAGVRHRKHAVRTVL